MKTNRIGILVFSILILTGCAVPRSYPVQQIMQVTATPVDRTVKGAGADVMLTSTAGVCPTKADYDEMIKLAVANDKVGIQQMIDSGRILAVSGGTGAKVIEMGIFAYRIRVTGGKYAGRDGWVVREAIQ